MNNRFKLIPLVTLLAAVSVSLNASAATLVKDFGDIGTYFSSDFGNKVRAGNFLNDYTFSFTEGSVFSGAADAKVLKANFKTGISDLTAVLIGPGSFSQKFSTAGTVGAGYRSLELDLDYLKAGTYTLEIGGTGASAGGSYSGTFSVSAVPEPKTYGMLLLGVGLMVVAARRKSNNI